MRKFRIWLARVLLPKEYTLMRPVTPEEEALENAWYALGEDDD